MLMGIIAKDDRQLTVIYSSNTDIGKKVHAYATAARDKLLAIDIAKTKVSDSQWAEIATNLGVSVGALIDVEKLDLETNDDFSEDDWLKILQHNDKVLRKPIAINGLNMAQMESYTDVLKFFDDESAGIEKTPHTEPPEISGD